jgi:hypothetical protein
MGFTNKATVPSVRSACPYFLPFFASNIGMTL